MYLHLYIYIFKIKGMGERRAQALRQRHRLAPRSNPLNPTTPLKICFYFQNPLPLSNTFVTLVYQHCFPKNLYTTRALSQRHHLAPRSNTLNPKTLCVLFCTFFTLL